MSSEKRTRFRYVLLQHFYYEPRKVIEILCSHLLNRPVLKLVTLANGYQAEVMLPDAVAESAYLLGDFEPEVTEFIYRTMAPGMVGLDVGAHLGVKTAFMKEKVGDSGRIISFEPVPATYDILRRNAARWNTETRQEAVLDESYPSLNMQVFGWRHSGQNTLSTPRTNARLYGETIQVNATTIDQITQEGIRPDSIKIDTENSDHMVVVGASETIHLYHPEIIFESGDLGRVAGQTTADTISLLRGWGYEIYEMRQGRLSRAQTQGVYSENGNLLASRKHF